jgi:diguanylate cyclase (GGDEF)-like protein
MERLHAYRGRKVIETMPLSRSPSAEAKSAGPALNGNPPGGDGLRRRFVEASRRAEIVALVNAATTEEELGLRFCEELCEVFEAEVAFVIDDGGERGSTRAVGTVGLGEVSVPGLFERPECQRVVKTGRAAALAGDDTLGLGALGCVLAPFRAEDGRVALVGVGRLYADEFDATDRSLVEAVTVAVGQALERIWAYEARNRSAAQQTALVRAAKSMSSTLEITDVLQTLCDEVTRAIEADTVATCLGDEVDGYAVVGGTGLPAEFIGFRQAPGTGLGGHAVRAGRLLVTHSYQEEGYAPAETNVLRDIRSSIAVPLRWNGRARGFLSAGYKTARRIVVSEVELVEGFAELAGLACANAERHAALREAAELDALTGCLNRKAFEHQLGDLIAEAQQGGEPLSLALLDLDGFKSINDVFGHLSGDAVLRKVGAALRSSVRAADLAARYGGDEFALILPNSSEERAAPVLDRVRTAIRSMDVPGGKLTACVGVAERTEGESLNDLLARADEALRDAKGSPGPGSIRRASRQVTMASVRAPRRLPGSHPDRRERWRATAGDIGLALTRQDDAGASGAVAAQELRDVLELDVCAVLQLVSDGKLEEVAVAGDIELGEDWLGADRGPVGRSLREKRAIVGEPPTGQVGMLKEEGELTGGELAVPLIIAGRAWGAIACRAGERELDQLDAELVSAIADHLSAAIRTDDLYEQLTQSMIGTAEALAAAMEAKDSYTANHASSIAELAVEVGRELELPESAIEDLRYGGIFHDIGKIAVPDAIINKPGPLTDEEFEVIKEHPAAGAEILAPVPFLYGVRTIVRHAHEHWDGSGYPDGLAGAQIPLGARVVLAVDAYHAMTSDRPYRSRMTHDEAYAELRSGAGTQFDPEVVDAVLSVLRRRGVAAGA